MEEKEFEREKAHLQDMKEYILSQSESTFSQIKLTQDFTEMVLNELRHKEHLQLQKSYHKPYFAKLVFQESGQPNPEEIYIGRFGLYDKTTLEPKVIDWRSPIANLYYENQFEQVDVRIDHRTTLTFDVWLKRNFDIQNGELNAYFDQTSAANINQILINRLKEKGEQKLKDIVETIQAEQNEIIRADAHQVLLVQGVAGSGKTTIALHRLAYLAYQYRDRRTFDNFLIVAPNQVFIDYISNVLPELGVEGVEQTTWEDLILGLLPKNIRIHDPQEKIMFFFHEKPNRAKYSSETMIQASVIRGSMWMKELLDKYIEARIANMIPQEDLILSKQHVLTHEEIHKKFHHDYQHYPYMIRLKKLMQSLTQWKDDCIRQVAETYDKKLVKGSILETERRIHSIRKHYDDAFASYCAKLKRVEIQSFYQKIITNPKNIEWLVKKCFAKDLDIEPKEISQYMMDLMNNKRVEVEDLAPLFYVMVRFFGLGKARTYSHIVVDEAQDLSPFQLYVLHLLSSNQSMTILGDTSQSIYAFKGINSWDPIKDGVFPVKTDLKILKKSYRSTIEIMDAANRLIEKWENPNKILAEPVLRHGEKPKFIHVCDTSSFYPVLAEEIKRLQQEGHSNIALIGKTIAECDRIADAINQEGIDAHIITSKETRYEGGISIVPIYLSKGMEFDAVILVDPTREKYRESSEIDLKLLYVAMTRALHILVVISSGNLTPFMPKDV